MDANEKFEKNGFDLLRYAAAVRDADGIPEKLIERSFVPYALCFFYRCILFSETAEDAACFKERFFADALYLSYP